MRTCGTRAESRTPSQVYTLKERLLPDHPSFYLSVLVHELRPADIKVVAALGDSLTVSTELCQARAPAKPCAESTLLLHWLCIQHLTDPIENVPVSGTETQPGSHKTSPGNLECPVLPFTVSLKHRLVHETSPHP